MHEQVAVCGYVSASYEICVSCNTGRLFGTLPAEEMTWYKVKQTLPPSCADCLEIWEPQPPGTHRARPGL